MLRPISRLVSANEKDCVWLMPSSARGFDALTRCEGVAPRFVPASEAPFAISRALSSWPARRSARSLMTRQDLQSA
jgi:hypothetical protein